MYQRLRIVFRWYSIFFICYWFDYEVWILLLAFILLNLHLRHQNKWLVEKCLPEMVQLRCSQNCTYWTNPLKIFGLARNQINCMRLNWKFGWKMTAKWLSSKNDFMTICHLVIHKYTKSVFPPIWTCTSVIPLHSHKHTQKQSENLRNAFDWFENPVV